MERFFWILLFCSCSSEEIVEEQKCRQIDTAEFAATECKAMKTLWQVDCYCVESGCIARHYACFWDLSHDGLGKNPEMADLYDIFYGEFTDCHLNSLKIDDVSPCEDDALARALARCEQRMIGFLADCDSGNCAVPEVYEKYKILLNECEP